MKPKHVLQTILAIAVVTSAALAIDPLKGPPWRPPVDPPTSQVDIPIPTPCVGMCCGASGGDIEARDDGSYVCHVDDDDPHYEDIMFQFESCVQSVCSG